MKIPNDNRWTQLNQGNRFGVLHDTQNINLETLGELQLSKKATVVMDSTTDAQFGRTLALAYFNGDYFVLTTDEIFHGALDGDAAFSELASVPALTSNSDMQVLYGKLYFTVANNFHNYNGSTVSSTLGALTSGVPHPMTVFDSLPTYKLAIGNGNTVKTYDSSHNANATTLTLPAQYEVTTLSYKSGFLYVGTRNKNGGEAKIFLWNGNGSDAQYEVPTGAVWIYSIVPYGQTCAAVTSQGQILEINGSSARQLASFPIYHKPDLRWQDSVGPKILHRGMVAVGNTLYLNVDGQLDLGFMPEMKSGIWVFDPEVGLYHRASFSTEMFVTDTSLSVTDSVITTSAAHGLKTGDTVAFDAVNGLSGVNNSTAYYVDVQSTTTIKLAKSRKSLKAGDYVTITGTADAGDQLVYNPNTHYGSTYDVNPGPIMLTVYNESPQVNWDSVVVWGGTSNNTAGTGINALMLFAPNFNVGSFTTQRIYSQNISDTWQELFTFIENVDNDLDKIIVKGRTRFEETSPVMQGTWAQANVINTLNTQNDEDPFDDIEVGDELRFVDGVGQGYSVHVTAIQDSTATRELTVDESLGTAGSSVKFTRDNFKKITTIDVNRTEKDYGRASLGDEYHGKWVQFRVELRGFNAALSEIELKQSSFKSNV